MSPETIHFLMAFAEAFPKTSTIFVFMMAVLAAHLIYRVIALLLFSLPNRLIRAYNISRSGWPPKHLDADGDHHGPEKDNARGLFPETSTDQHRRL